MTSRLNIIVASTRPGRVGASVGKWFHEVAAAHPGFEANLVDLAEFDLPVYDEPKHPRLQDYAHEHTKKWAASVASADAFVFVTPEYNYGTTPALLNALNYVYTEWNYKPAGFVSYAGVSGGMRAVEHVKPTLNVLKVVPLVESVLVPMVSEKVKDGVFTPGDIQVQSAKVMLDELARWTGALKPLRG
ncbi:NAD(P)H-dependent oxidoreductase (plasmid) [Paroceanicella profunda]|uniref:NAD(P)H-dependent oxidoreductase n=1 Tax=Paroceanicella profunda TaxID=2579971 RepID=A0A5B8G1H7_9RHOB|nr:NAD(P)H-dependent oxidoreductase [Paroceanicella profunda]QDL93884.1 NAD(P)H-dependent oxidoreductase [Paroceanicella profunda]